MPAFSNFNLLIWLASMSADKAAEHLVEHFRSTLHHEFSLFLLQSLRPKRPTLDHWVQTKFVQIKFDSYNL